MTTVLEHPLEQQDKPLTKERVTESVSTAPPQERLFTVDEYYRMGETGLFNKDGQVELFQGRIYKLSPKNPLHSASVRRAGRCLEKHLGKKAFVRMQEPVRFDNYSEPEPDIAVVKSRKDEYAKSHPTPEDCLLLLEVSLTTLKYDRDYKGRAYAAAGVSQYLILNLRTRELEDYREPSAEGYRTKHTYRADESFNLVAFPDVEISVAQLLPLE